MHDNLNGFIPISKVDDEQRMVYGIAQSDTLDNQDEIVEWEATKSAVPEYMKWRNLREMHKDSAVGTVPEIEIRDPEKQLYIGAKVVDDGAWKKVKEGVYKGFSIGGKALDRAKEFAAEMGKTISRVKKYVLNEISLVDRPANPDCTFSIIKRDDDELPCKEDPLSKDVNLMRKIVESLDKKILTKKQISSLKDDKFALLKNNDGGVERLYPIPDKAHAMALLKQLMKLNVSDKERFTIHNNIKKVLANKHSLSNCEYCRKYAEVLLRKGEGGDTVDREKLEQAKALIEELLAESPGDGSEVGELDETGVEEEFEGQSGDDSVGAETENIVDSPEKDETEDVPELQGSKYSDKEGGDEDEDSEGFDENTLDYSTGLTGDENRTHLYDSESERKEKQELEGGDCPYCGATVKALMSGQFRKNSAVCPGCHVEYAVGANPKVTIVKRGGNASVRKSSGGSSNLMLKVSKVLGSLDKRLSSLESKPLPRKNVQKVAKYAGAEEEAGEVKKSMPDDLKSDMDKAVAITKSARAAGKELKADERAFCESVLERSIEHKVGGKSE